MIKIILKNILLFLCFVLVVVITGPLSAASDEYLSAIPVLYVLANSCLILLGFISIILAFFVLITKLPIDIKDFKKAQRTRVAEE